ncbi:Hypothetical predicted protein [Octopus vulgaris]|uniref:Uncharacterized protein n=1 Tax=Octopus vulgaris TaxID=6645 RepID=A0AA36B235_OCTVU|nr:Hypothetical predicted protein [Octopus vulgaris]
MSANVQPVGFLARLRAGAKRILEAIIPCIKKTGDPGDEVVDFTPSLSEGSLMTTTTEEPLTNRNESAANYNAYTLPGSVRSPDLFDPTYFAVSSDDDTDTDDFPLSLQLYLGAHKRFETQRFHLKKPCSIQHYHK